MPFWRDKQLADMTQPEWESLCDGCGLCCLVKLEDEDTGKVYTTDVACVLMDGSTCRCKDYEHRFQRVSDCLKIDLEAVENLQWLPATCAYRLVGEGRDLYWWHHLVSGSTETVHEAGVSIRHKTISEDEIDEDDLPDRITEWGERG
ncbi:YcgN family cysteine cluster protein [Tepidamorphus sp. 3E244]|uniref:YcgN family cysteine cluster protein n=1 Tax=Tepidamorphus sp. 3E244 TaxID=3385498 RepID=UPI0038FC1D29